MVFVLEQHNGSPARNTTVNISLQETHVNDLIKALGQNESFLTPGSFSSDRYMSVFVCVSHDKVEKRSSAHCVHLSPAHISPLPFIGCSFLCCRPSLDSLRVT